MPRPKAAKAQAAPAEEQALPAEEAPASQAQEGAAPAKKKRNNNPGVRVQGGRVYDSENGTTCHQCRQKTIETNAKCTKCTLYFCPKCLENRYHEKVADANAAGDWAGLVGRRARCSGAARGRGGCRAGGRPGVPAGACLHTFTEKHL